MTGEHDVEKMRRSMVDYDPSRMVEVRAKMTGLPLSIRYLTLVATINGTPGPDPEKAAAVQKWVAAALRR
jgi:hypothetical protein